MTTVVGTTIELVNPELLYCDRCGAQAKVRVVLSSGNDLVFCGHHDRKYAEVLTDTAGVLDVHQL